jgi:response regulator RpfG family c-di-GMP phosphodiesterase
MGTAQAGSDGVTSRPRILCVDDEPYVLEGLRDMLRRSFEVRVATSGREGLEMLRADPEGFAVVISDMRMPQMSGSDFLREARLVAPDAVRLLLTGHADLESAIKAVNGARLFRFLTKPCDSSELLRACAAAFGQHRLQSAERVVLEQTLRGSVDALAQVLALTNPAAFGRGSRVKTVAGGLARAVELRTAWEVEVAAMLAHIGAVTLPQATAENLYAGKALTHQEAAMVERVPAVTRRLLSKIPRLEGVLEILDTYQTPGAELGGTGRPAPAGALVLRIAVDYDELQSQGASDTVALGAMQSRGIYDRALMDALVEIVGVGRGTLTVHEVSIAELKEDMTLADDVRSLGGSLLVARGQRVSDQLIERLGNLSSGAVREPLRVFEADPADLEYV